MGWKNGENLHLVMKVTRLLTTLSKLYIKQIVYQIIYRINRPAYKYYNYHNMNWHHIIMIYPISKRVCWANNNLSFLNVSDTFYSWNDTRHGMLWAYNLNYMDWLMQEGIDFNEGVKWIDSFVDCINENKIGLEPYPIALRGINWIKFISLNRDKIAPWQLQRWNNSLYSQYRLLERSLEYHLLGNHLLEDAYSLFFAAIYFQKIEFYKRATSLLEEQLKVQVLEDGAHFEQSPMYHCILLDRLLDCYNISIHNDIFDEQEDFNKYMSERAVKMLGHLESIIYRDGSIPILNDSAYEIAPNAGAIFDYARRLNIEWEPLALKECGYRKISIKNMETILDIGDMVASYQPGHSHADTFNYELRLDGTPFIIDTGISTYNKNSRRQFERSTPAHNTVCVRNMNSSEVWGGFRVGRRAKVSILEDSLFKIAALHNGFGNRCTHVRTFEVSEGLMTIKDVLIGRANIGVSYIHFAPDVNVLYYDNRVIKTNKAVININGCNYVNIEDGLASTTYNALNSIKVAIIGFSAELTYTIVF